MKQTTSLLQNLGLFMILFISSYSQAQDFPNGFELFYVGMRQEIRVEDRTVPEQIIYRVDPIIRSGGSVILNGDSASIIDFAQPAASLEMGEYTSNHTISNCVASCPITNLCNSNNCGTNNTRNEETMFLNLYDNVEWGNANSTNLDNRSSSVVGAYSRVWLLPKIIVDEFSNNRSYTQPVFDIPGEAIEDGQWSYFSVTDNSFIVLPSSINNIYPMNITVEELDALVEDDIEAIGSLRLRFTFSSSSGGGMHSRFSTSL